MVSGGSDRFACLGHSSVYAHILFYYAMLLSERQVFRHTICRETSDEKQKRSAEKPRKSGGLAVEMPTGLWYNLSSGAMPDGKSGRSFEKIPSPAGVFGVMEKKKGLCS